MLRVILLSAFLFAFLCRQCLAETFSIREKRALATRPPPDPHHNPSEFRFRPPITVDADTINEDLRLMDIVLVASVDGKFHALNRTSGQTLWTMSASSAFAGSAPSTLGPLVRTTHIDTPADEDADHQELYIIEPQSGDIYVMASPSSPLQRLAFSMSQLVDMSPFSFSVDDDRRVFVGRKETSLFSIELETGKVKEVNSECPWDPFEDLSQNGKEKDIDLEDLEGSEPPKPMPTSTEISIGRTDYHITIHTRPASPSSPKPPVQNLSFSTYGPNNRDGTIQTTYRRSVDDAYVQSFPNGDVFAFKTAENASGGKETGGIDPLWINKFSMPVVAVFDVLQTPDRTDPFVLLQPRPRLEDGLTSFKNLPNLESAYVGLVPESGSLFAMSPRMFPLVAFGNTQDNDIASARPGLESDSDWSVDKITERRKLRELCRNGGHDRKCLIGIRGLEESRQSWSRLLDAAAVSAGPPNPWATDNPENKINPLEVGQTTDGSIPQGLGDTRDNTTIMPWIPWTSDGRSFTALLASVSSDQPSHAPSILASFIFTCLLGALWVYKKVKAIRVHVNVEFKNDPVKTVQKAIEEVVHATLLADADAADDLGEITPRPMEEQPAVSTPVSILTTASAPPSIPPSSPTSSAISDTYVLLEADNKDVNPAQPSDQPVEGEDSDREGDVASSDKRKGTKKKRRGKKKKGNASNGGPEDGDKEKDDADVGVEDQKPAILPTSPTLIIPPTPQSEPIAPSLVVSDTILGFGSHGTVVFSGSLQGRAVAVKRLLQDFVTLASREVSILQESDDHPNVIRYYYQEAHANFLYIALELCPASLADIIESPDQFRDISVTFDPKRALRQITSGLRHLHSLKLVHRDIKPQNILVSSAKKNGGKDRGHRMLISDFGLCKKLDIDQTSFLPTAHGALAAGTVGWRAPEILRGEVKLDESAGDESQSSRGSVGTSSSNTPTGKPTRLTKLVDIFALGCLFYYTLTNGGHPYGDRFEREVNILKNVKSLEGLERFGEEGSEAAALITSMLSTEASDRPDTTACLLHPFFWDQGRRLTFLQDASDRFEIMCRDPRDHHLITLETGAFNVVGNDWHSRLDKIFIENLGKYRKYDGKSVQDLMRALRNKKHHYQDLPENVKRHLGPMPEGFLSYFTRRFPRLFLHVHSVIANTSLRHESMFRSYFELAE